MVDKPKLTPSAFAKRQTTGVPSLERATPSLRQTPSVTATGAGALASSLASMADDANRLRAIEADRFNFSAEVADTAIKEIQLMQGLAAEKQASEDELKIAQIKEDIRAGASDPADIPTLTQQAIDDLMAATTETSNMSSYQRGIYDQRMQAVKVSAGLSDVNFVKQLAVQEAEFTFGELRQADVALVRKDPSQLKDVLAKRMASIDEYGQDLDAVQRKILAERWREDVAESALYGDININPFEALKKLNAGGYKDYQLSAKVLDAAKDIAEQEVRAKQSEVDRNQAAIQKQEAAKFTSALIAEMAGVTDEGGAPIRMNLVELNDAVRSGRMSANTGLSLSKTKQDLATTSGNPRLAAELRVRALQQKNLPDGALAEVDVLNANYQAIKRGEPGMNRNELADLVGEINAPADEAFDMYIGTTLKAMFFDTGPLGSFIASTPQKADAYNRAVRTLNKKRSEFEAQYPGRDSTVLIDSSSAEFIIQRITDPLLANIRTAAEQKNLDIGFIPPGLPEGSEWTGKFTTDGRRTYRTPEGTIVAPKVGQ